MSALGLHHQCSPPKYGSIQRVKFVWVRTGTWTKVCYNYHEILYNYYLRQAKLGAFFYFKLREINHTLQSKLMIDSPKFNLVLLNKDIRDICSAESLSSDSEIAVLSGEELFLFGDESATRADSVAASTSVVIALKISMSLLCAVLEPRCRKGSRFRRHYPG